MPDHLEGQRLDAVARELFQLSWGAARRWIDRGKLFVDDQPVLDQGLTLCAGQELSLRLEAPRGPQAPSELVVFRDRSLVVLRKPPGISTVPHQEREGGTLIDWLRRDLSRRRRDGDRRRSARPPVFVVQRLDRATSGLLVMARTRSAADGLGEQFRAHTVHRRYLALVEGHLSGSRTMRSHLVEDRGDGRRGSVELARWSHVKAQTGKLAITTVTALTQLDGPSTLIRCQLETGRTNQIRIHLSEAGHPLLGEDVYLKGYRGKVTPASRLMLHAAELGFRHPLTGRSMRFEEPLPEDMAALIEKLQRPSRV